MKRLAAILILTQPFYANADAGLSNFLDLPGGKVAAVAWKTKGCTIIAQDPTYLASWECPTPEGNTFYAPTVLIFGKTGQIEKSIPFFDDQCSYNPVKLSQSGQKLILTVEVMSGVGSDVVFGTNQYPDCQYSYGSIFKETRSIKTGDLLNRITLQDYRTTTLP
jgi:hypothetical protein